MFKNSKINSAKMENVHSESANFMDIDVAHLDINRPSNLFEMVTMIGMENVVSRARLLYTQECLELGILKTADIKKHVICHQSQHIIVIIVV